MENSYRFLMMAATLIVGILLLSMLVYVFRAGARASKAVDEAQMEQQLIAENAKFEHYNRPDNTASDMISLINLTYNYNRTRDFSTYDSVNIIIHIGQSGRTIYIGEDTTIPGIHRKSSELERNQVWYSESVEPLSVNKITDSEEFVSGTTISFPKLSITAEDDRNLRVTGTVNVNANDKLSLTRYDAEHGKTIYKYLFMLSSITYDSKTSRVKAMEFRACVNDEF